MSKRRKYTIALIVALLAVGLWSGRHSIVAEVLFIRTAASEVEASGV